MVPRRSLQGCSLLLACQLVASAVVSGRQLLQPIDPVFSTAVPTAWSGKGYKWGSNTSAVSPLTGNNPANGQPVAANGAWRAGDTFVSYAPGFSSGVASGDPLPGQIILWTRFQVPGDQSSFAAADPANTAYSYNYTPAAGASPVTVSWWVNDLPSALPTPNAMGVYTTDGSRDWTVKLDVNYGDVGVAGTLLYYGFSATYQGVAYSSPVGSFRAINLANNATTVNYAVASCSNWGASRCDASSASYPAAVVTCPCRSATAKRSSSAASVVAAPLLEILLSSLRLMRSLLRLWRLQRV